MEFRYKFQHPKTYPLVLRWEQISNTVWKQTGPLHAWNVSYACQFATCSGGLWHECPAEIETEDAWRRGDKGMLASLWGILFSEEAMSLGLLGSAFRFSAMDGPGDFAKCGVRGSEARPKRAKTPWDNDVKEGWLDVVWQICSICLSNCFSWVC